MFYNKQANDKKPYSIFVAIPARPRTSRWSA